MTAPDAAYPEQPEPKLANRHHLVTFGAYGDGRRDWLICGYCGQVDECPQYAVGSLIEDGSGLCNACQAELPAPFKRQFATLEGSDT